MLWETIPWSRTRHVLPAPMHIFTCINLFAITIIILLYKPVGTLAYTVLRHTIFTYMRYVSSPKRKISHFPTTQASQHPTRPTPGYVCQCSSHDLEGYHQVPTSDETRERKHLHDQDVGIAHNHHQTQRAENLMELPSSHPAIQPDGKL